MYYLVDLTYYAHENIQDPAEVLKIHYPAIAFGAFSNCKLEFIKHMGFQGQITNDPVRYTFFKRRNRFWQIPWPTHRYIKKVCPDIVLVQGLIFPLQLMMLRFVLGPRVKIIVQHHGESPYKGIKKALQKIAARYTDAWLFTSIGNTEAWVREGIIPDKNRCYELPEASTYFKRKPDREEIKKNLGMSGKLNFLWVGRLNENKDPITVIEGFGRFALSNATAVLYMIFQEVTLLSSCIETIRKLNIESQVKIIGHCPHQELEEWYNAADYFISGSHREGSGYALIEAIACGCIPIVTHIPPFIKLTNNGRLAFLFTPGDATSLFQQLQQAVNIDRCQMSDQLVDYFHHHLSFNSIAEQLDHICQEILYSNTPRFLNHQESR